MYQNSGSTLPYFCKNSLDFKKISLQLSKLGQFTREKKPIHSTLESEMSQARMKTFTVLTGWLICLWRSLSNCQALINQDSATRDISATTHFKMQGYQFCISYISAPVYFLYFPHPQKGLLFLKYTTNLQFICYRTTGHRYYVSLKPRSA